jgi:hypothetical protein
MLSKNKGLIRPYSSFFGPTLRAIDILIIGGCLYLCSLVLIVPWNENFTLMAFASIISYVISAELTSLYGSWRFT